jgi:hypothetical protein
MRCPPQKPEQTKHCRIFLREYTAVLFVNKAARSSAIDKDGRICYPYKGLFWGFIGIIRNMHKNRILALLKRL